MAIKVKASTEVIQSKNVFVGNRNAEVTLMEFGEYENEDCAKANEVVKQLLSEFENEIKFNFRHFPMANIHQHSMKAAEAAVAAAQEGKFWEMHNLLFENRKNLGTTSLKIYAREAGIVSKNYLTQLINSVYGWQVRNDLLEGLGKGIKQVPAFFINGELYKGKVNFEELKNAITVVLK